MFDTRYPNRKDRRRPYRGAKSFDTSCRNHGGCPYCLGNRRHSAVKRERAAREAVIEAAVAWGEADIDDATEVLAAELTIALALGELEAAQQGVPNPFPTLTRHTTETK